MNVESNNSRWPLAFLAVSLHAWTVSLYGQVVESLSMEIMKPHLDMILGNCSRWPCLSNGTRGPSEVPANLSQFVPLCVHFRTHCKKTLSKNNKVGDKIFHF